MWVLCHESSWHLVGPHPPRGTAGKILTPPQCRCCWDGPVASHQAAKPLSCPAVPCTRQAVVKTGGQTSSW